MSKFIFQVLFFISVFLLQGCATQQTIQNDNDDLTVGVVQREVSVGMSASDVVSVLGSPNIVTTNEIGGETWVYDKISQEVSYDHTSTFGTLLLIGSSNYSGSSSSSQRTLTIILKFNSQNKIETMKYHTSSF